MNVDEVIDVLEITIKHFGAENICVVSGGAKGADLLGKQTALIMNLKYEEYNPSHTEHNIYSVKPKEILMRMEDFGVETNILTIGEKGALIGIKGSTITIPAFKTNAIDTTGAGDTFTSSFLSEYIISNDIERAGIFASSASDSVDTPMKKFSHFFIVINSFFFNDHDLLLLINI